MVKMMMTRMKKKTVIVAWLFSPFEWLHSAWVCVFCVWVSIRTFESILRSGFVWVNLVLLVGLFVYKWKKEKNKIERMKTIWKSFFPLCLCCWLAESWSWLHVAPPIANKVCRIDFPGSIALLPSGLAGFAEASLQARYDWATHFHDALACVHHGIGALFHLQKMNLVRWELWVNYWEENSTFSRLLISRNKSPKVQKFSFAKGSHSLFAGFTN